MEYGISYETLYKKQLEIGTSFNYARIEVIKAGQGTLLAGQVLAYDPTTLKLVKYVAGAGDDTEIIVGILLEDVTVGTSDASAKVLRQGAVVESSLVGIDYINPAITIDTPVVTKLGGGSLTAGTYEYKIVGISTSGNTVPSTLASGTTETTNLVLKVVFDLPASMDTVRVYRDDTDYYDVTAEELAQSYILDDGSKTWIAGVPVSVTDYAGIKTMEKNGIYANVSTNGYSFRK